MRSRLLLFIVFLPLVMSSCQNNGIGDNELPDLAKAQSLAPTDSIDLESRGILNPVEIRFCDDFLVLGATTGKQEMHFLDLRDMKVTEKIIVGSGPKEVSDYELVLGTDRNHSISYMDTNKMDVYAFDLDSLRENPATEQKWLYQVPKNKDAALLEVPLETERYVYFTGVYLAGEHWIYCFDKQTKDFRSFGDFPAYEELASAEYMTKSMVFATMVKATNGKRLVLCHYGTLDFYDMMEDGGLRVFREHHYFLPDITIYPNGTFAYKSKSKRGFNYVISSDEKYVYLLYSDKTIHENPGHNSEYLFVYDWDGNPIVQYALEKPLYNLAVNGTTLYGLSREVEPIVYIFHLDDLSKK